MRLQIVKLEMSKNIRTRDGARSWLRGFDAQLGHLHDACTLLPQKS